MSKIIPETEISCSFDPDNNLTHFSKLPLCGNLNWPHVSVYKVQVKQKCPREPEKSMNINITTVFKGLIWFSITQLVD